MANGQSNREVFITIHYTSFPCECPAADYPKRRPQLTAVEREDALKG